MKNLIFALFMVSPLFTHANDLPKAVLFAADGVQSEPLSWAHQVAPLWEINSDGVFEFYWAVTLEVPVVKLISNIQAQKALVAFTRAEEVKTKGATSNRSVVVKMRSLSDNLIITYDDDSRTQLKLQLSIDKNIIINEGCEPFGLAVAQMNPNDIVKNSYLAYRCEPHSKGLQLAISAPEEFVWASSSMKEQKGSEERWRSFLVKVNEQETRRVEVGKFELKDSTLAVGYLVYVDRLEVARKISNFRFSVGTIQLGFGAGGQDYTLTKLAAHVSFDVRPVTAKWSLGGQGIASLPSLDANQYFTHMGVAGYTGYMFFLTDSFKVEPRAYMFLAEGINQQSGLFYIVNTVAFGAYAQMRFFQNWILDFETYIASGANESLQSFKFNLGRQELRKAGWGVTFSYDMLEANKMGAQPVKANQVYVGPYFDF